MVIPYIHKDIINDLTCRLRIIDIFSRYGATSTRRRSYIIVQMLLVSPLLIRDIMSSSLQSAQTSTLKFHSQLNHKNNEIFQITLILKRKYRVLAAKQLAKADCLDTR